MPPLSIVIITKNEERNIGRCLKSVKDIADDIVVVDSFSEDATEEICKSYHVNFIKHQWEGYSATKNFANDQARHDWILSLDADEALSDELIQSISKIKALPLPAHYKFSRLTNYCGKWIRHCGWYPDYRYRFFDRRTTHWEGLIHEKLNFAPDAKFELLQGDCLHYSYYSTAEHWAQAKKFSELAALDLFQNKKKSDLLKMFFSPVIKFIKHYFLKLGFMDGSSGLRISYISAWATFHKYRTLKSLEINSQ